MQKAKVKDIPQGAVTFNREEAINHVYHLVRDHDTPSHVYLLKYGVALNGMLAAFSGIWCLKYYRRAFGLRKEVAFTSSLTCGSLPAITTYTYQYLFVLPPILLQEPGCPICLELKAGAIQFVAGAIIPVFMGLVTASMTAAKLGFNVPPPTAPLQLLKLGMQIANHPQGRGKIAALSFVSLFGSMCLVYGEQMQMLNFTKRLQARQTFTDD
ncbi:uncharacterized protein LOC113216635 [Frankliniella occidentalis]|uniref:Uncharacterized protein LOC113216635 n=1 Tax=Frankliniella occidentalis TaxID=133901 RepID=A0A6J1TFC0_FRAOC|nr:uncharacterized protein LOC113216635 [Frankliniella occidentalis]XP_026292183.1 uncharacterized protein LOC113216635 [Frankliniella occidentalis]XP_026292184.1 uncharacterized protein LOC113216635 [Frankliniella occidentalis]